MVSVRAPGLSGGFAPWTGVTLRSPGHRHAGVSSLVLVTSRERGTDENTGGLSREHPAGGWTRRAGRWASWGPSGVLGEVRSHDDPARSLTDPAASPRELPPRHGTLPKSPASHDASQTRAGVAVRRVSPIPFFRALTKATGSPVRHRGKRILLSFPKRLGPDPRGSGPNQHRRWVRSRSSADPASRGRAWSGSPWGSA